MNKQLILIRHAQAEPFGIVRSDFDRTLIPKGVAEAKKTGAELAKHAARPDGMIASSAPRALYTLKIIAGQIGFNPENIMTDRTLYDCGLDELISIVRALPDEYSEVILCGHNPVLSEALSAFCGGASTDTLNTADAAALNLHTETWADAGKQTADILYRISIPGRRG